MVRETRVVDGISIYGALSALLRLRATMVRFVAAGAIVALLLVATKPKLFTGSASFFSQPTDAGRSGLASLAGQFGVALSAGPNSVSPEFYSRLIKARVLLAPIVRRSFAPDGSRQNRKAFLDLFDISGGDSLVREDRGIVELRRMITTVVVRQTGAVEVSVRTPWRQVSLEIVQSLLDGVNEYNKATRQIQAREERVFIEGRLRVVEAELRENEDKLERFLISNRITQNSPQLIFERERLQRAVGSSQLVLNSLKSSFEEVRVREVRDTPLITIVEVPNVPASPEPRRRLFWVAFGGFAGAVFGALWIISLETASRRRRSGDEDLHELQDAWIAAKGELRGSLQSARTIVARFGSRR
jgi:uncharacterized protein involved in exopolysaccharide biosynthesis